MFVSPYSEFVGEKVQIVTETLLEVKNLSVSFQIHGGEVQAVRGVSLTVHRGETLAIVGESGSGKSVTAQSLMRLTSGSVKSGEILFEGRDLLRLSKREMLDVRGKDIAMIFQDPMTALNPTMTVGKQIVEMIQRHLHWSSSKAWKRAVELLHLVGIPQPEVRAKQYPHMFSGGMRQRAVIAMAIAAEPKLLIADEPTTALDVTIQAQILDLLNDLKKKFNMSMIFITHDLGVVARVADHVAVMYGGKVVESGNVVSVFKHPQHPYTWGLLNARPHINQSVREPLLSIPGSPPDLFAPPKGCPFVTRCAYAMKICELEMPSLTPVGDHERLKDGAHQSACWLLDERAPKVDVPFIEGGDDKHERTVSQH